MKKLKFIKSQKLLNVDNNAKTVKGQKYGFMTAILYLAPSPQSGFNVCPQASNGCKKACLYTAGHGAFNSVKQGRINKTRWYIQERETFLDKKGNTKVFRIKEGLRFKPLEYLCDDIDLDILEEEK